MERVVNVVGSFEEADEWDIHHKVEISSAERQIVARTF